MPDIVGKEWNVQRGYFNTALRGIPPRASVDAAQRTLELWSRGDLDWIEWLDDVKRVRSQFATLIGVSPTQVGVGHTTAALVNVVAANLQSGSRVLVLEKEHNSNTIPFLSHQYRGIVVDTAPWSDVANHISREHAVVALSLAQSIDGSIADLRTISQACRSTGSLLCVDVTQAAGWLPADASLADIIVCSSYKAGVSTVYRHNAAPAEKLCARLSVAYNGSAIVMLEVPGAAQKLKARGIRAAVRGDQVRIAIHIYNDMEDVEALVTVVLSR